MVKVSRCDQVYLVLELCTSGLCGRFAKPLGVCKYVPEVRILPAPLKNLMHLVYTLGAFLLYYHCQTKENDEKEIHQTRNGSSQL